DAVDDAEAEGLRGLDEVGGPEQLQRLRWTDEPGQEVRVAIAGDEADLDVTGREPRVGGGDTDVAHEAHPHAGAHGEAVDHGDDGLVHRLQRLRHAMDVLPELVLVLEGTGRAHAHAADVAAGAEGPAASGDDYDVDVGVALRVA